MDTTATHPAIIDRCAALGLSCDKVKRLAGKDRSLRDLAFMLALDPHTLAPVRPKHWLWIAAQTCSVSYRRVLTPERLQTALVSGTVAPGDESTFQHFLDDAPLSVVFMAGEEAARKAVSLLPRSGITWIRWPQRSPVSGCARWPGDGSFPRRS